MTQAGEVRAQPGQRAGLLVAELGGEPGAVGLGEHVLVAGAGEHEMGVRAVVHVHMTREAEGFFPRSG